MTRHVFRAPAIIAAISTFGLLSALLGDGVLDALSWIALGLPVVLTLWYWTR